MTDVNEYTLCRICQVAAGEHATDAAGNLICPHRWRDTHFTPQERDDMPAKKTITTVPDDRKTGATLADLAAFTAEAERSGIAPTTPVRFEVGFRGQARKIEVSDS